MNGASQLALHPPLPMRQAYDNTNERESALLKCTKQSYTEIIWVGVEGRSLFLEFLALCPLSAGL